ncbi:MAG: hypothetical protein O2894_07990 [Planctomycetota bacterium]|nr:hypothetical protein [Planctomycetota bacterium]
MPSRPLSLILLLGGLLLGSALPGCGRSDPAAGGAVALDGPPAWRLASDERRSDDHALSLRVQTPLRVRLRHVSSDQLEEATAWRTLSAGQSLRILWSHQDEARGDVEDRPSRDDEAAGRSEPRAVRVLYHFGDWPVTYRRLLQWVRPGQGRVQAAHALPPGRYEALPSEGSIELATVVLSDLAQGEVRLRRREYEGLVLSPADLAPLDQVLVWRLYLDLAPLAE